MKTEAQIFNLFCEYQMHFDENITFAEYKKSYLEANKPSDYETLEELFEGKIARHRVGLVMPELIERYRDVSFFELCEIFKPNQMNEVNQGQDKKEQLSPMAGIFSMQDQFNEVTRHMLERLESLNDKIMGSQPREDSPISEPPNGALPAFRILQSNFESTLNRMASELADLERAFA